MATATSIPLGALPISRTRLVGRDAERAVARSLLLDDAIPLLTLTGPGGVGKTRLALAIANDVADVFSDGIAVADFSPLADSSLVPSSVLHALGIAESGSATVLEQLQAFLHPRQMLLLFDNCEHVIEAAAGLIATLLAACPALQILATSRAPLRVRGEHDVSVPPLALPDRSARDMASIGESSAVILFVERANAANAAFALTPDNVTAVTEICRRLDGLPLAIEVAAAWSKVLPPSALLARLDNRLLGLTGGPRDLPARQQTLRDTIAWSYNLLPPAVQRQFRHLAVFAGDFDLAAADAIVTEGSDGSGDVLSGIAILIEHNLLNRVSELQGGEPRFRLLETIRAFAQERLAASGEEAGMHAAHAAYFLNLVETVNLRLRGSDQLASLDRLEAEHDNLRAALAWAIEHEKETALRIAGALDRFWTSRGHLAEGRAWQEQALAAASPTPSPARDRMLRIVGGIAMDRGEHERAETLWLETLANARAVGDYRSVGGVLRLLAEQANRQGDLKQATALLEETLALFREYGISHDIALALQDLGAVVLAQGDLERAAPLFEESLSRWRAIGDQQMEADVLSALGKLALEQGELVRAAALLEEGLSLVRAVGDQAGTAIALDYLGEVMRKRGEPTQAAALHEESLVLFRQMDLRWGVADALDNLGRVEYVQGAFVKAASLHGQALAIYRELDTPRDVVYALSGLAAVAVAAGQLARAACLYGAADAACGTAGISLLNADVRAGFEMHVAKIRTDLGEEAFAAAWATGGALSSAAVDAEAFAFVAEVEASAPYDPVTAAPSPPVPVASPIDQFALSPREHEIVRLLCQHLTNKEIAEALFVSARTVQTHTINIFTKLGVDNRREAAAIAARHGLA